MACVPGTEYAMKITRPLDLVLAETLLAATLAYDPIAWPR